MAYRIEYPGPAPELGKPKHPWKWHCLSVLLLLVLLGSALLPSGRRIWMNVLIPGDDKVTQVAFSGLVNEMRQGGNLKGAFLDFCEGMLDESV